MRARRVELEIDELVLAGLPREWDRDALAAALGDELAAGTARHGISGRVAATGRVDSQLEPGIAAAPTPGGYGRHVGAAIARGLSR